MKEISIIPSNLGIELPSLNTNKNPASKPQESFGEVLKNFLGEVNSLQKEAGQKVEELSLGGDVDLHEVMIKAEEAAIAFQLLLEIRNKLMDAYQELMRMQV